MWSLKLTKTDSIRRLRSYHLDHLDNIEAATGSDIKNICKKINNMGQQLGLNFQEGCYYDPDKETFSLVILDRIDFHKLKNLCDRIDLSLRELGRHDIYLKSTGRGVKLTVEPAD